MLLDTQEIANAALVVLGIACCATLIGAVHVGGRAWWNGFGATLAGCAVAFTPPGTPATIDELTAGPPVYYWLAVLGKLVALGVGVWVLWRANRGAASRWDGAGPRGTRVVVWPAAMLLLLVNPQCLAALAGLGWGLGGMVVAGFTLNVPLAFASLVGLMGVTAGWPAGCG